jgi:hypothetical protein
METLLVLGMFILSVYIQRPFPLITIVLAGILGYFIGLRMFRRGNL